MSAALHVALLALMVVVRPAPLPPRPPVYSVNIVAAPPGPRQIGVVRPPDVDVPTLPAPQPAPTPPTPRMPPAATPNVPERPTVPPAAPTKAAPPPRTPTRATPVEPSAASGGRPAPTTAPRAGGGPRGDRGTDVATVRIDGIDFPYPGYLNNIVRQIALNFTPAAGSQLRAEVSFTIRRDGSLADVRIARGSGDYEFDLEARGAVEAAAPRFGPLPAGFSDDALPVVFSFDPQLIR